MFAVGGSSPPCSQPGDHHDQDEQSTHVLAGALRSKRHAHVAARIVLHAEQRNRLEVSLAAVVANEEEQQQEVVALDKSILEEPAAVEQRQAAEEVAERRREVEEYEQERQVEEEVEGAER